MSCSFDQELLTGYYDDALDARERESVDRHIAGCSDCLRQLEEIKGVVTQLKTLPRAAAPAAVREGISRELATVRPASFRRILLHFSAAAAAAVLVVITVSIVTAPSPLEDEARAQRIAVASRPMATPVPSVGEPATLRFESGAAVDETKKMSQGVDPMAKDNIEQMRRGAKAKEEHRDAGEDPASLHDLKELHGAAHGESARESDLDRKLPSPLTPVEPAKVAAAPSVLRFRSADVAKAREVAAQYLGELSLVKPAPDLGFQGGRFARTATLTVELTEAEVAALLVRLEKVRTVKIVANPVPSPTAPPADPAPSRGMRGMEVRPTPSPTATASPAPSPSAAGGRGRLDAAKEAEERMKAEERTKKAEKAGATPKTTPVPADGPAPAAKPAPSAGPTEGKSAPAPAPPGDKEKEGARDPERRMEEAQEDGTLAQPVRRSYILIFEVEPAPEATPVTK